MDKKKEKNFFSNVNDIYCVPQQYHQFSSIITCSLGFLDGTREDIFNLDRIRIEEEKGWVTVNDGSRMARWKKSEENKKGTTCYLQEDFTKEGRTLRCGKNLDLSDFMQEFEVK